MQQQTENVQSLESSEIGQLTRDGLRPSIPGPGRTVLGAAEVWGAPIREATKIVRAGLSKEGLGSLERLLAAPDPVLNLPNGVHEPLDIRGSRALVTVWLLARATRAVDETAGFADAEIWFSGHASAAGCVGSETERVVLEQLRQLPMDESFADLLPYILDPHSPGTRRSVLRDQHDLSARMARKNGGVFYTPGDVADFMVAATLEVNQGSLPSVLDPACGSGVFLRAALRRLVSTSGQPLHEVAARLYGIDVSLASVEACAFVLLFEWLRLSPIADGRCHRIWRLFRLRLACADSLLVGGRSTQFSFPVDQIREKRRSELSVSLLDEVKPTFNLTSDWGSPLNDWEQGVQHLFPEVRDGFDCLVANPPYAKLGNRSDLKPLSKSFEALVDAATPATNSFVPFVELMWGMTHETGSASMVVPLSVAYSSLRHIRQLRAAMQRAGGEWRFAFFDRTPDALFGDDVKQRSAILFRRGGGSFAARCTPLYRWTSRTRSRLFSSLDFTPLDSHAITDLIPKLSGELQAHVYSQLRGRPHRLDDQWIKAERVYPGAGEDDEHSVFVAGTAYNWLSLYRSMDALHRGVTHPSTSPVFRAIFSDPEQASMAYAVLSSRLIYWLWRVEGDAFHVPRRFVSGVPFNQSCFSSRGVRELAQLGWSLWEEVLACPVVSSNGGRQTVSYCPHGSEALLDAIDGILIRAGNLHVDFGPELKRFLLETVVVDLNDSTRNGKDSRPLAAWSRS